MTGLAARAFAVAALCLSAWALPAPASAQGQTQAIAETLVIDRERLFAETRFGKRVAQALEVERARLEAETRRIQAELEVEELELTELRVQLSVAEFRIRADAFDEKVQALRDARERENAALVTQIETEQAEFFKRVAPVLFRLVSELGASVVLDRRVIFLADDKIDITDRAIRRIDAEIGDGSPAVLPGETDE